jgi:hypothetical protein
MSKAFDNTIKDARELHFLFDTNGLVKCLFMFDFTLFSPLFVTVEGFVVVVSHFGFGLVNSFTSTSAISVQMSILCKYLTSLPLSISISSKNNNTVNFPRKSQQCQVQQEKVVVEQSKNLTILVTVKMVCSS